MALGGETIRAFECQSKVPSNSIIFGGENLGFPTMVGIANEEFVKSFEEIFSNSVVLGLWLRRGVSLLVGCTLIDGVECPSDVNQLR